MIANENEYVTCSEAAELWGVQTGTVRKWIKRGKIPFITVPVTVIEYRIPRSAITERLAKKTS